MKTWRDCLICIKPSLLLTNVALVEACPLNTNDG